MRASITLRRERRAAFRGRRVAYYGGVVAIRVAIETGAVRVVLAALIGAGGAAQVSTYLVQNSHGFFVALCVALYLDLMRPVGDEEQSSRQLLTTVLTRRFGLNAPGLDALASTLLAPQPDLRDVCVDYVLEDLPDDPSRYRLATRSSFTIHSAAEYVLAITSSAELSSEILARGRVMDVWKVSNHSNIAPAVQRALSDSPVHIRRVRHGLRETVPVQLQRVLVREHRRYGVTADGGVLLRGSLPARGSDGIELTTDFNWEMAKDDHYCYWVADRPLFLERITFDCRSFTVGGQRPRIACRPLLSVPGTRVDSRGDRYTVDVGGWLTRGQGVILVWR